jgi:hypothetical protein
VRKERNGLACGRRNLRWVVDIDSSIVVAEVCICRFGGRTDERCVFDGRTRTIRLDMIVFDILKVTFFANFF